MESSIWGAVIRIIVCLPIVVIMAVLLIKFGLARNYNRTRGNLRILEQVELMPKSKLCVVKVGAEYLLLGITEKDIAMIKQLDGYQAYACENQPNNLVMSSREKDSPSKYITDPNLKNLWNKRSTRKKSPSPALKDRNYGYSPDTNARHNDFQDIMHRLARRSEVDA